MIKQIFIFVIILHALCLAQNEISYTDAYDDPMLYLHALVNYSYNVIWQFEWEQNQFSTNGFRISVGSVTATDLLTDWGLKINHDLGAGWRFQGIGTWNETRHKSVFEKSAFMGLEKNLFSNFNIHLLVNPTYFKENTDLNMGFTIYNDSRESYLRLALQYEDFVYDSKNDFNGKSLQAPLSATWSARAGRNNFWLYTEGRLSTGFKRTFPDEEKSPDLRSHDQLRNDVKIKMYYTFEETAILMMGIHLYQFSEKETFSDQANNYDYENRLVNFFMEYMNRLHKKHRMRLIGHVIGQDALNSGYRAHEFSRTDYLAGGFYEYIIGSHSIEMGYMFAIYDYDYVDYGYRGDFNDKKYTDKVKLGWIYAFPKSAQIMISLSHQLSVGGFGGANLQYMMFF
jgi:hypothetical protein